MWAYFFHVDVLECVYFYTSRTKWKQTALASAKISDGLMGMKGAFDFRQCDAIYRVNFGHWLIGGLDIRIFKRLATWLNVLHLGHDRYFNNIFSIAIFTAKINPVLIILWEPMPTLYTNLLLSCACLLAKAHLCRLSIHIASQHYPAFHPLDPFTSCMTQLPSKRTIQLPLSALV